MGVFNINVLNDFDVLDVVIIADVVAKQIYGTGVYFKKTLRRCSASKITI